MGYKVRKRGKYYWLYGRVKGIRLDSSLRTTVKREAEEIAKAKVRSVLERVHGVRMVRSIKLGPLLKKYLEYCERNNRPSTFRKKRFLVRNIVEFFGDIPLAAMTAERVEAFKHERLRNLSPATVNRELAALKHALRLAVEWDYLEASPAARVKKLREPPGRVKYLTWYEADGLVAACSKEVRPVVVAALHTGMRLGELLALEWKHVDLRRRQIRVVDSKNNGLRVVPVNDVLYSELSSLKRRGDAVFLSRYGRPYRDLKVGFATAMKRAGITDFRFHDLRHTFASWLAMKGVPMSTIGELLGHKTPQMTMRYAHLAPEYLADIVALLTQNKHKAVKADRVVAVTN